MIRPRSKYVTIAVLAGLSSPALAAAEAGVVIAGGNAAPQLRATATSAVEHEVQRAGWEAPQARLTSAETEAVLACKQVTKPWMCLASSIGDKGIDRALVVFLDASRTATGAPQLVLTAKLIVTHPESLIVRQQYCEGCTDDRLRKLSSELARDLIAEQAARGKPAVLEIKSVPPGAAVLLDGKQVGITDVALRTSPGKHVVSFRKDGHRGEVREVETASARRPSCRSSSCREAPRRHRPCAVAPVPAGLLLGGGLASLGTGLVVIAIGQKEDPDEKFRYSFPRAYLGTGLAVAGAVAISVGIAMWVRGPEATSAPTVSVTSGGGVLGWARTF